MAVIWAESHIGYNEQVYGFKSSTAHVSKNYLHAINMSYPTRSIYSFGLWVSNQIILKHQRACTSVAYNIKALMLHYAEFGMFDNCNNIMYK